MKIWFPYVFAGTGSDVFTQVLSDALRERGHEVTVSCYAHAWQYFPWRLRLATMPTGTEAVVCNSWNAFAFKRPNVALIVVEHLFVLDKALSPYRSAAQSVFHNTLVRYFVGRSYRAASRVVALSEYGRQQIMDVFPKTHPIVIFNGIDTTFFSPLADDQEPLGNRKLRLLFVGNPTVRKGADLLPRIMEQLGPRFELRYTSGLRGNDPFRRVPAMVPLGKLNREETRMEYRTADLFLFPSRLEGLPLSVMEALACGLPAVVSNASSLPEMIHDGDNGKVCAKDDVVAIASAVREISEDPDQLDHMRKSARESAENFFSLDHMLDRYESLLASLMNKPKKTFLKANSE